MPDKTPVRVVFNSDNVATGLGEFQSGETVPLANGGTGSALTIGTVGQVLRVNAAGDGLEFADQGDVDVIASSDSTGVQVQDDLNVSGTLSVNVLDVNEISSQDSTGITIKDDLLLQGTLRAEDSSIISIDGSVASSGSITSGSSFIIGSADMNETDLEKLDGITNGTVAANKAVVVDASKDIGTFGTITGSALVVETISSADSTSVFFNDGITVAGPIKADDSATINIDDALDVEGAITTASTVTATGNITTSGSFVIGSADMSETDLEKLDGITNGTVAASKAVVVDASKDIGTFGTITGAALVVETISSADSTSVFFNDGITLSGPIKSDASASINIDDALDVEGAITSGGAITAGGNVTAVGSFVIGSADMSETDLEKLDGITDGTAAANKALVADSNIDIDSLRNVTATGTIQGATITATGTLNADIIDAQVFQTSDSTAIQINEGVNISGAIVGASTANISGNLTIGGAANIAGDLTVSGTTTYVDTTNVTVADPLMILSKTNSGGSDVDAGIMIERGSAGNNAVLYWNEGDDKFKAVLSTSGHDATAITDSSTATLVANIEGATVTTTGAITAGTSFVIGSADINETDLTKLDGITNGTVAANKAVVVDASKDIGTFGTITGAALVVETISSADSTSVFFNDGITLSGPIKSDASASINIDDALDVEGAITTASTITATGDVTTSGSFVIGSADMNETDLEKLDGITNGTVAANKAVVVDASKDIGTFGTITGAALVVETISSADSTSVFFNDGITISGPIKADASGSINIDDALDVEGTVTFGSLSDGTITATAFVDEDDMSSNSASLIPTQQSVKAYVDTEVGNLSSVLEIVGDDSTKMEVDLGTQPLQVSGGNSIRTDTSSTQVLTVALDANITVDSIESQSSSEVEILNIRTDTLVAHDSTQITIRDALRVTGTITGTVTAAQYADLAEIFPTDDTDLEPGDVVHFAGQKKVAKCNEDGHKSVAGVVSTEPGFLLNEGAQGVKLAMTGRVPCKVTGNIEPGDLLVSAGNGRARAEANPSIGTVIGKAVESSSGEGVIDIFVTMM